MDEQQIETEIEIEFEPAQTLPVQDPEALKLLTDPFRSRLLDLLRANVQTAKELAQALGLSPKKLYYHLKLLEQHGLIRVVNTRIVSGIIEKSYRATAYLFLFDGDMFRSAVESGSALPPGLQAIFDTTRTQLEASFADGLIDPQAQAPAPDALLWGWTLRRLSAQQATAFYTRFAQLLDEFAHGEVVSDGTDCQNYRILMTLFPVKAFLPPPEKKTK
jgi:DNA-binding transcriptional ArsR family regulator